MPSTYGASGGGRPSNDHHVTPSALQLPPPYAYFPQYHSPYGPAQPPLRQPVGFAPPSSAMSSSGGGGVRRGFDAFEQGGYGSVRAEDEMRAAQRRKLAHETELAGGAGETEVDELEEGSQATPPGSISEWNGKVQESLGVEKLGEEQEEKGKGKKKKKSTTTRGVQVDNPYDIPAVSRSATSLPFVAHLPTHADRRRQAIHRQAALHARQPRRVRRSSLLGVRSPLLTQL